MQCRCLHRLFILSMYRDERWKQPKPSLDRERPMLHRTYPKFLRFLEIFRLIQTIHIPVYIWFGYTLSLPKSETGTGIYATFLPRVPAYLCEDHVMTFKRLDPFDLHIVVRIWGNLVVNCVGVFLWTRKSVQLPDKLQRPPVCTRTQFRHVDLTNRVSCSVSLAASCIIHIYFTAFDKFSDGACISTTTASINSSEQGEHCLDSWVALKYWFCKEWG
jgi:hypothetical protein